MSRPVATGPAIDERDLRRVCGDLVFRVGEDICLRGSVLYPRFVENVLSADVVANSWSPAQRVSVALQDGQHHVVCGCGPLGEEYCEHAAALLITWSRYPQRFARADSQPDASGSMPPAVDPEKDVAITQLAGLLEQRTLQELRQIARRRNLPWRGAAKGEVVPRLAAALLEPENLDAAIRTLSAADRVVLDVVSLLNRDRFVAVPRLGAALAALGVAPAIKVAAVVLDLRERGLVVAGAPHKTFEEDAYCVPAGVVSHLAPIDYLVRRAGPDALSDLATPKRLPPDEVLYRLWQRLQQQPAMRRAQAQRGPTTSSREYHLPGWCSVAEEVARLNSLSDADWRKGMDLAALPPPPEIADGDLDALASMIGGDREEAEFGCGLLKELGLIVWGHRLCAMEDALRRLMCLAPAARRQHIADCWLQTATWSELMPVLRLEERLRLRRRASLYVSVDPQDWLRHFANFRQTVVDLLMRLTEGVWYSMRALSEAIRGLAGDDIRVVAQRYQSSWWLEWEGHRLDPKGPEHWALGYGRFVEEVVRGPLSWLGGATVSEAAGETVFRIDGLGALLGLAAPPVEEAQPLRVGADMSIAAPFEAGGVEVHEFLQTIAEPGGLAADGLRYQITAQRLGRAFAAGLDAAAILSFLERRSEGVPDSVREQLRYWWQRYGQLQLYSELCLIELADDYTLPELLANTGLAGKVIHQFSPRLIVVDPEAVDGLVDEMVRKGYTPKIVEGGQ